jgi:hypothetical protein
MSPALNAVIVDSISLATILARSPVTRSRCKMKSVKPLDGSTVGVGSGFVIVW